MYFSFSLGRSNRTKMSKNCFSVFVLLFSCRLLCGNLISTTRGSRTISQKSAETETRFFVSSVEKVFLVRLGKISGFLRSQPRRQNGECFHSALRFARIFAAAQCARERRIVSRHSRDRPITRGPDKKTRSPAREGKRKEKKKPRDKIDFLTIAKRR